MCGVLPIVSRMLAAFIGWLLLSRGSERVRLRERDWLSILRYLSRWAATNATRLSRSGRRSVWCRRRFMRGDGAMMVPMMRDVGLGARSSGSETVRLFARLDALFARGADTFGLPVGRITEPIQVVRYGTGGHFQMWHSDAGGDRLELRHISTSVELSDLADQDTGALEVVPVLVGVPRRLELAGAPIFPSQALHQVGPVPRGTRWPLVAWTG